MEQKIERHTISVLVENEPGVLARVIGLFSGRGYNIESLTVAEVDEANTLSRITVVAAGTAMVIEQILVKVNGEIISQSDLEDRQVAAIRGRGLQPSTNAELFQLISEVTPEVLATAVEELLLVQRGKELGYQLSDGQFRDFLDNLKTENGFETDEEFIATLERQEGMTLDDFRRLVERQMLASQVQQVEILKLLYRNTPHGLSGG